MKSIHDEEIMKSLRHNMHQMFENINTGDIYLGLINNGKRFLFQIYSLKIYTIRVKSLQSKTVIITLNVKIPATNKGIN